jgi:phosphatidylinositol glycan class T
MPYNVIILTSTVMALAFGSVFNLLVRRFVGADEDIGGRLQKLRAGVAKLKAGVGGRIRKGGDKTTKTE